jgi:hypothetical protein
MLKSFLKSGILFLVLALSVTSSHAQGVRFVSESISVSHGDYITHPGIPACGGGNSFDAVQAAAQFIASYYTVGWTGTLGGVLNMAVQQTQGQLGGAVGNFFQMLYGDHTASCGVAGVVIPAGSRIVRIEYGATDFSGAKPCFLGQDCQIGWSRFDPPQFTNAGASLIITSVFRNWSHDRQRNAAMTVYFIPPWGY